MDTTLFFFIKRIFCYIRLVLGQYVPPLYSCGE